MERKIYISNETISLAEYQNELDAKDRFDCWQDPETQSGYNFIMGDDFEAFYRKPVRARFLAVILRNSDGAVVGSLFLSPETSLPDLAIMLYRPYRGQGYGTEAFALALQYCFDTYDFEEIYAGCYEHNKVSMRMLKKSGFVPHPEGNVTEKHYISGEPITQYDFVKYRDR